MAHRHVASFDFAGDRERAVFICRRVAQGAPVLHASLDGDGDWQFLCGGVHEDEEVDGPDGPVLSCLGCVVSRDPSLNAVARLGHGWWAERESAAAPWRMVDPHEQFIRDAIERTGWAVTIIPSDDAGPGFAYTTGLYRSYGAPELIVFGLRTEVMHSMLNTLGELAKGGQQLAAGQRRAEVIEGFDVQLRAVTGQRSYREHLGYALWLYGGPAFPVLQVVYPDKHGRFPGQPGVAPGLTEQQPLLD